MVEYEFGTSQVDAQWLDKGLKGYFGIDRNSFLSACILFEIVASDLLWYSN